MCGRFASIDSIANIEKEFFIERIEAEFIPRYNIAPQSSVGVIVFDNAKRSYKAMRWGLIPSWSKDSSIGAKLINARAETIEVKPSFRSAFRRRRCLIVASGFYEWKKAGGIKIPHYITLGSGRPMAFAGIYEYWESPDAVIESCAIITTSANELIAQIHERMPVVLSESARSLWLNPETARESAKSALTPYPSNEMEFYQVGPAVNNPRNDSPDCVLRIQNTWKSGIKE